jgi:hypothetical protein
MSPRAVDRENPDRLYTVTQGRTPGDDDPFDLVSIIVSERDPAPGMQSEHAKILRLCRNPTAVVEIAAVLELPASVVKVLLRDLRDTGSITVRHPVTRRTPTPGRPGPPGGFQRPDRDTLKQVLRALEKLLPRPAAEVGGARAQDRDRRRFRRRQDHHGRLGQRHRPAEHRRGDDRGGPRHRRRQRRPR